MRYALYAVERERTLVTVAADSLRLMQMVPARIIGMNAECIEAESV